MRKVKIKNLVIFLLCSVFLTLFEPFGSASANAAINRSISSESDKIASVDDDGNLRFKLSAQAASSGTRWKTVGLYVTSDPTGRNGKESTKAKDCVFFDKLPKGCSKSDKKRGDTVITSFTISKEVFNSMCDKAGVNLKTLQVLQPSDFSKQEAFSFDPGKLLILTGNSMSGQALQEILLREYGLQMEMASGNYVVAMTSIMDTDEGFARLSDALECIDGTVHKKEKTSEISPREIYREQKTVMTIEQARDAEKKTVRLEEATGEVSGDYVYLYPPGIPILVPGEAIDVQTAEPIRHCIRLGLEVEGLPDLTCINVVK